MKHEPTVSDELKARRAEPSFEDLKKRVFAWAGGRCQVCNQPATECHHWSTRHLRQPDEWRDCVAMCEDCYERFHTPWREARRARNDRLNADGNGVDDDPGADDMIDEGDPNTD